MKGFATLHLFTKLLSALYFNQQTNISFIVNIQVFNLLKHFCFNVIENNLKTLFCLQQKGFLLFYSSSSIYI